MVTRVAYYQLGIDTTNHCGWVRLLTNRGEVIEEIITEDLDRFSAMARMVRYERPLLFDDKTGRLWTSEHEPVGEGEDQTPFSDHGHPLQIGQPDDTHLVEENGDVHRHFDHYKIEINVPQNSFTIKLFLREKIQARILTESPKLFALVHETLRNYGQKMVWQHHTGVLSSEILPVGGGNELESGRASA